MKAPNTFFFLFINSFRESDDPGSMGFFSPLVRPLRGPGKASCTATGGGGGDEEVEEGNPEFELFAAANPRRRRSANGLVERVPAGNPDTVGISISLPRIVDGESGASGSKEGTASTGAIVLLSLKVNRFSYKSITLSGEFMLREPRPRWANQVNWVMICTVELILHCLMFSRSTV